MLYSLVLYWEGGRIWRKALERAGKIQLTPWASHMPSTTRSHAWLTVSRNGRAFFFVLSRYLNSDSKQQHLLRSSLAMMTGYDSGLILFFSINGLSPVFEKERNSNHQNYNKTTT